MKKLLILLIFTYSFSLHSQCFTSISAGGVHVLGKKADGTVWCWGYNIAGLLGDNLLSGYSFPTQHRYRLGKYNAWQCTDISIKNQRYFIFLLL